MSGELLTTNQLIVIVVGIVATMALSVMAIMGKRLGDLAESAMGIAAPGLIAWRNAAESTLAGYGNQLKPVHDILLTIKPYVDSPDDTLYKRIAGVTGWPVATVAAVGASIWAQAEDLTDGDAADGDPDLSLPIPAVETIPADKAAEASK